MAKVGERETDVGGGLIHTSLEWQEPIDDTRVPGLESLLPWLQERPGEPGGTGEKGEKGDKWGQRGQGG